MKLNYRDLDRVLTEFKDIYFNIHIITPKPRFENFGKTKIDISDISNVLIDHIRKTVNKEKRRNQV